MAKENQIARAAKAETTIKLSSQVHHNSDPSLDTTLTRYAVPDAAFLSLLNGALKSLVFPEEPRPVLGGM